MPKIQHHKRARSFKQIYHLDLVDSDGSPVRFPNIPYELEFGVISQKTFTMWPGDRLLVRTYPSLKIRDGYRSVTYLPTHKMTKKGLGVGGEIDDDGEVRLV